MQAARILHLLQHAFLCRSDRRIHLAPGKENTHRLLRTFKKPQIIMYLVQLLFTSRRRGLEMHGLTLLVTFVERIRKHRLTQTYYTPK